MLRFGTLRRTAPLRPTAQGIPHSDGHSSRDGHLRPLQAPVDRFSERVAVTTPPSRLQRPRTSQGLQDLRRRHRNPVRQWPLLKPGQDPASLEARVAYHLHRLRLTGKPLRDSSRPFNHSDLVQARCTLTPQNVAALAKSLCIPVDELTRELTVDEQSEWEFYRYSSFNAGEIWQRAAQLWRSRGFSDAEAAYAMGLEPSLVSRNLRRGQRPGNKVLTFARVQQLLSALRTPGGPEQLIVGLTLLYRRQRSQQKLSR